MKRYRSNIMPVWLNFVSQLFPLSENKLPAQSSALSNRGDRVLGFQRTRKTQKLDFFPSFKSRKLQSIAKFSSNQYKQIVYEIFS